MTAYKGWLQGPEKQNPCLRQQTGVLELNLDDDLLSHGETPHYHRRCIVSLLSSGWDQVVPMLYGRQEILCTRPLRWQRAGEIHELLHGRRLDRPDLQPGAGLIDHPRQEERR